MFQNLNIENISERGLEISSATWIPANLLAVLFVCDKLVSNDKTAFWLGRNTSKSRLTAICVFG